MANFSTRPTTKFGLRIKILQTNKRRSICAYLKLAMLKGILKKYEASNVGDWVKKLDRNFAEVTRPNESIFVVLKI